MLTLFVVLVTLALFTYVTVFKIFPPWVRRFLIRHPGWFMLIEFFGTIPILVAMLGTGLIAGALNLATSSLFVVYMRYYAWRNPDILLSRRERAQLNEKGDS